MDFSIDASYEFAEFVLNSTNVKLTHVPKICIVNGPDCATYPRFFHPCVRHTIYDFLINNNKN